MKHAIVNSETGFIEYVDIPDSEIPVPPTDTESDLDRLNRLQIELDELRAKLGG